MRMLIFLIEFLLLSFGVGVVDQLLPVAQGLLQPLVLLRQLAARLLDVPSSERLARLELRPTTLSA